MKFQPSNMKLRGLILCSSVADLSLIICDFDTASDLSFRSFNLSCEIVVGSWVGISQVKIKSRLSRSALLPFVLRMIAETPSNVIQWMELGNLLYRFCDSVSRGYL